MKPERWRQIEALYHSAREHGIAVLEGTDPGLRREVEKLLARDSSGQILDLRASEVLDELTVSQSGWTPANLTGRTIAHYEILDLLGAGGMGVVYKARDTRLNRLVALKCLPPQLRHDQELKDRLADEARAASALDHPNIVVIHDILEAGDEFFIAMAFHEGVTLRAKIDGPLPVPEALKIAHQVASGLAKAHEHGISHRDIKPSNIVVAKDGIVRIIDFGLARSTEATATLDGAVRGTPLYMSPEQASGKPIDTRTDLWSLGVVLYEMLAGVPPFRGESVFELMGQIAGSEPAPLSEVRPGLPPAVAAIVDRALQKDPARRYQSAAAMTADLTNALAALDAPPAPKPRKGYVVLAALFFLAAGTSLWLYQQSQGRLVAREKAIPEIARLADQSKALAAYQLLVETRKILPEDAQLSARIDVLSHLAALRSTPPGATVSIKDYFSPGDPWFPLGTTPLDKTRIPSGYLRWRVSKPGMRDYEGAPLTRDMMGFFHQFDFSLPGAESPADMVKVPAAKYADYIWSLGDVGPYDLPEYYIDKFEVTNRQYHEFVEQGGYRKRQYWKEKLIRDGRELTWEQAMELLRDSTGRPGPSTWVAGNYPEGQAEFPVGGVSWYEAAAYAEYAGKSLPVLAQWFRAAPSSAAKFIVPMSNFSGSPAPVGKYAGIGPWGTYDMAGNVTEWCQTGAKGGSKYTVGGGYSTATNEYFEPGSLEPFYRAAVSGFRCVRNMGPLPKNALADYTPFIRDFAKAKPVGDEIYRIYKNMYGYDRKPLNAKLENVPQDSKDWRKEKVVIDAAYGQERLPVYLFIPARVRPPYQSVVFFPTARSMNLPSSENLTDMKFIDFVIQSGRAVVYPVYKSTYERTAPEPTPDKASGRETLIHISKDMGRSLDYLETRPEFDKNRLAYMGVSEGAALGVVLTAVDERFKTVIFLDGGVFQEKLLPGTDQADFAPRLKAPVLLITGTFDWIFLGKEALMRLFGAPASEKRAVQFDTGHDVSEKREDLVREVLAWLDQYLGRVQ